jgi:hypothetical protein
VSAGSFAAMRASDADRAQVQTRLNEAFAEGRLTKEEWDERATALASAASYADLDQLTADLPVPYVHPGRPSAIGQQGTNGLAVAALICGIGQLIVGLPAGIAAIILGHKARRQIRQTGEQGAGLARAGLALGYAGTLAVALVGLLVVALVFAIFR